jgi:hypothetical protein
MREESYWKRYIRELQISEIMEKEIVQAVIAGEVLCNALFDLGITEKDHVYIKQEGNHIEIGRAKTTTKSDKDPTPELLEFYKKHFPGTKIELHSKKMLFKMLEELARLRLDLLGRRKKYESVEELCQKENLEPDEGMELIVEDLIDTAIYHSLLHPEKPFGYENE